MKELKLNSLVHMVTHMSSLVREDQWEGEEYWIVPTVLMVEGVHNDLLYSAEDLKESAPGWNGEPVVAWHPTGDSGESVTANDPATLSKYRIGQMFDCLFTAGKLKGDAWISKKRAAEVSPELVAMIQAGQPIEVSTGVFIDDDEISGTWNGESYTGTATKHRPDHLAFLPGGKGACSWDDGGGAPRVNQKKENDMKGKREWLQTLRQYFQANEPSHDDLRSALSNAIATKFPPPATSGAGALPGTMVVDVFDKYAIYARWDGDQDQLFKVNYNVGADDSVELSGDPLEVRLRREYVPVVRSPETLEDNTTKGGVNMDRKTQVDSLIALEDSRWAEDNREFLMALEDDAFTRITTEPVVTAPKSLDEQLTDAEQETDSDALKAARAAFAEAKVEKPAENAETLPAQKPIAVEDLPLDVQRAVRREQTYKAGIVEELTKNARCKFSAEQLAAKEIEELETLAQMVEVEVNYDLRSTGLQPTENEDEGIPPTPAMNWDKPTA